VVRFLSDEWLEDAARLLAGAGGADTGDAVCSVEQVVVDGAGVAERARYHLVVDGSGVALRPGPAPQPDVVLTESYDTAAALSRGDLAPAAAMAAGSITVRGDLKRLGAVGSALAGVADALAPLRARTEY
jgi:hypothetical protein